MSYNGSGVYTLPGAQLANGEIVSATENNQFRNDVAAALNVAWTRDGQAPATANIPMGNHKLTGLAAGTGVGDSVRYEQFSTPPAIGNTTPNTGKFTTVEVTNNVTFPDSSTQNTAATGFGFKNRIINGAMMIDQRNAGASQTFTAGAAGVYCIDRFLAWCTGANVTGQRINGLSTFKNGYRFTGAASNTGISFAQRIESNNIYDCASSTVTLSATIANSLLTTVTWTAYYPTATDNYTGITQIATGTFTVTSTAANYSANITLPANATNGLYIIFSVANQTSGTWDITGVQLEKGSTATSFDYRPYGTELALCQRYAFIDNSGRTGQVYATSNFFFPVSFPVEMRASPTLVTKTKGSLTNSGGGLFSVDTTSLASGSTSSGGYITVTTVSTGFVAGDASIRVDFVDLYTAEL